MDVAKQNIEGFSWPASSAWTTILNPLKDDPRMVQLRRFVADERRSHDIFPESGLVMNCFALTPADEVRVVILGQDPYHGPGQAHGLSFSVLGDQRIPPSLRNIYRELKNDLGIKPPLSGDLSAWARSGVLLLNTILTVRSGHPLSHRNRGWEWFTDEVIRSVSDFSQSVVFMLWGNSSREKGSLISGRHLIIESSHPSPFSAHRGFLGSRPFSAANEWLVRNGREPVDWRPGSAG